MAALARARAVAHSHVRALSDERGMPRREMIQRKGSVHERNPAFWTPHPERSGHGYGGVTGSTSTMQNVTANLDERALRPRAAGGMGIMRMDRIQQGMHKIGKNLRLETRKSRIR